MKRNLLLLLTICLMSFGMNAQINSVALVGEAVGGWPGSAGNPGPTDINQLSPVDAENWIIENITIAAGPCKLRANNAWSGAGFEWAGAFPTAVGTSSGDIIVPTAGIYNVTLNTTTGVYNFEPAGVLPTVKLIGTAVTAVDGLLMSPSNSENYFVDNATLVDGTAQFDVDATVYGGDTFPSGVVSDATLFIPVTAGNYSSVTLNIATGEYVFELAPLIPPVSIVGDAVGGWPGSAGNPGPADINQLTSEDGTLYTINKLACIVGPAKFRQDNDWSVNWGSLAFPIGTGTQGGSDIAVSTAGTYDVTFNRSTGDYSFLFPSIAIVGEAVGGWPGSAGNPGPTDVHQMTTTDGVTYTINNLPCVVGPAKFRQNNDWGTNWGSLDFPVGTGTQGGADISVTTVDNYDISLNRVTGAYSFSPVLSNVKFNNGNFKVYPNPSQNVWNVASANEAITSIQIVDVLGKTVMTVAPQATSAVVDGAALNSGIYFARIATATATSTIKLVRN